MKKFEFYVDRKSTIWRRSWYEIEANSIKEALDKCKDDYFDENSLDSELIYDTEEEMLPSDNNGYSTVEIYDTNSKKLLYTNSTKE